MRKLFLETLIVGMMTAIVGFIISTLFMLPSKDFSFKKYHFWPQVVFSFFLTGAVIHLICELSGLNKWYCSNGNACINK